MLDVGDQKASKCFQGEDLQTGLYCPLLSAEAAFNSLRVCKLLKNLDEEHPSQQAWASYIFAVIYFWQISAVYVAAAGRCGRGRSVIGSVWACPQASCQRSFGKLKGVNLEPFSSTSSPN